MCQVRLTVHCCRAARQYVQGLIDLLEGSPGDELRTAKCNGTHKPTIVNMVMIVGNCWLCGDCCKLPTATAQYIREDSCSSNLKGGEGIPLGCGPVD